MAVLINARVAVQQLVGIVAARDHLVAILRVAEHRDEHLVELQIAAARRRERAHGRAIGLAEIREQLLAPRVHARRRSAAARAFPTAPTAPESSASARRSTRSLQEPVVLEHRMPGEADPAVDADAGRARRRADEADAEIRLVLGDAVEAPEKIEMPPRAAQLAVRDAAQAQFLLLFDDALDLAVLDGCETGRVERSVGVALPARLLQRRRAQQAADVVGAKRRRSSSAIAPSTAAASGGRPKRQRARAPRRA